VKTASGANTGQAIVFATTLNGTTDAAEIARFNNTGQPRFNYLAATDGGLVKADAAGNLSTQQFAASPTGNFLNEDGTRKPTYRSKSGNYVYNSTLADSVGVGTTTP